MDERFAWTAEIEDEIDFSFIQRIQMEVTAACSLPIPIPVEKIPMYILMAAQWFWENVDSACEDRYYVIPNKCINQGLNRTIQLPPQIRSVYGCHKLNQHLSRGALGDFSVERMIMSNSALYGASPIASRRGNYRDGLTDAIFAMYEVSTFDQYLNPPLSFNYNEYSNKLILLGGLHGSDLLIEVMQKIRLQDLYNSVYFFRLVSAYVRKALAQIYGTYEFKLPGGVTLNYSMFADSANDDIEEIKTWAENNRSTNYFFNSNTV